MSISLGSVHGRFQPFHNGHMAYTLGALSKVDILYIGITKVEPGSDGVSNAAAHRHLIDANPLSYFQRAQVVEAALLEYGISLERFRVIPFPIEKPHFLKLYFPVTGVCFTTLKDEWNKEKIGILENQGYSVDIINEIWKYYSADFESGTNIRNMIRNKNPQWKSYIPKGALDYIENSPDILESINQLDKNFL